jgi:hypothetical protein
VHRFKEIVIMNASRICGIGALAVGTCLALGRTARAEVVTTPYGFNVDWEVAGTQTASQSPTLKIATCGHNIVIALNNNYEVWFNGSSGADNNWVAQLYVPQNTTSIACDGKELIAFRSDSTFWKYPLNTAKNGLVATPTQIGADSDVVEIGSGTGTIWAVDHNASVWMGNGTNSGWAYEGSDSDITHITSGINAQFYTRVFAWDNDNTTLWFNDGNASVYIDWSAWHPLPASSQFEPKEIAANSASDLYSLDATTNYLWHGTTIETACFDGVDNDLNGLTDADDPACWNTVGTQLCLNVTSGNFCLSRLNAKYGGDELAVCNGGVLTRLEWGCVCNQSSTWGADTLECVR